MPWVKLDDRFFDNPKIRRAGKDGRELYLSALTYSASALTDGFVHQDDIGYLAARAEVTAINEAVARLVAVHLWQETADGYLIHDYHEYNPSADAVHKARQENARRQAEWQEKHRNDDGRYSAQPNSVTSAVSNTVSNDRPVPVPVPVPVPEPEKDRVVSAPAVPVVCVDEPEPEKPKPKRNEYPDNFEQFWRLYPRKEEKASAFKAWQARLRGGAKPDEIFAAAGHYASASADTELRFVKLPASFLGPTRDYEEWVSGVPPGRIRGNGQRPPPARVVKPETPVERSLRLYGVWPPPLEYEHEFSEGVTE